MRKIIRNIKYWFRFKQTALKVEKRIKACLVKEFREVNPKVKTRFRFQCAKDFHKPKQRCGTCFIGVLREDKHRDGRVSTWYTLKEYFKITSELNNKAA